MPGFSNDDTQEVSSPYSALNSGSQTTANPSRGGQTVSNPSRGGQTTPGTSSSFSSPSGGNSGDYSSNTVGSNSGGGGRTNSGGYSGGDASDSMVGSSGGDLVSGTTARPAQTRDEVRTAQSYLGALGLYNGKFDGLNGPKTRAATLSFQQGWNKDHPNDPIQEDGILGWEPVGPIGSVQPGQAETRPRLEAAGQAALANRSSYTASSPAGSYVPPAPPAPPPAAVVAATPPAAPVSQLAAAVPPNPTPRPASPLEALRASTDGGLQTQGALGHEDAIKAIIAPYVGGSFGNRPVGSYGNGAAPPAAAPAAPPAAAAASLPSNIASLERASLRNLQTGTPGRVPTAPMGQNTASLAAARPPAAAPPAALQPPDEFGNENVTNITPVIHPGPERGGIGGVLDAAGRIPATLGGLAASAGKATYNAVGGASDWIRKAGTPEGTPVGSLFGLEPAKASAATPPAAATKSLEDAKGAPAAKPAVPAASPADRVMNVLGLSAHTDTPVATPPSPELPSQKGYTGVPPRTDSLGARGYQSQPPAAEAAPPADFYRGVITGPADAAPGVQGSAAPDTKQQVLDQIAQAPPERRQAAAEHAMVLGAAAHQMIGASPEQQGKILDGLVADGTLDKAKADEMRRNPPSEADLTQVFEAGIAVHDLYAGGESALSGAQLAFNPEQPGDRSGGEGRVMFGLGGPGVHGYPGSPDLGRVLGDQKRTILMAPPSQGYPMPNLQGNVSALERAKGVQVASADGGAPAEGPSVRPSDRPAGRAMGFKPNMYGESEDPQLDRAIDLPADPNYHYYPEDFYGDRRGGGAAVSNERRRRYG